MFPSTSSSFAGVPWVAEFLPLGENNHFVHTGLSSLIVITPFDDTLSVGRGDREEDSHPTNIQVMSAAQSPAAK